MEEYSFKTLLETLEGRFVLGADLKSGGVEILNLEILPLLDFSQQTAGEGCSWAVTPSGYEEQKPPEGAVRLGGGRSQNELPRVEVPEKSAY